jgi:hypothetical protein
VSLVVALCAPAMLGPLTVTVTPGSTAPVASFTVPMMDPVVR